MANTFRQVAYKVWISDLLSNEYVIQQGEWEPNYVAVNGKKVSRTNIVAMVIDKQDSDMVSSIDLDDGSGVITARCFKENTKILKNIQIGDLVLLIGRPRKNNNNEMFLAAEIARKLESPLWAKVRKLELEKEGHNIKPVQVIETTSRQKTSTDEDSIVVEEIKIKSSDEDSGRLKIINLIKDLDQGSGASQSEIIEKSNMSEAEVEKIIHSILESGDAYNPRPNRIALL
ncbi:MAG: hypothetical protein HYS32_01985 [Candidatus Woesearchaeota archaeon]|nr:MAG: hypothetical protein HYS32_01985 [Candidatus Woesearchaeota archaeon]